MNIESTKDNRVWHGNLLTETQVLHLRAFAFEILTNLGKPWVKEELLKQLPPLREMLLSNEPGMFNAVEEVLREVRAVLGINPEKSK